MKTILHISILALPGKRAIVILKDMTRRTRRSLIVIVSLLLTLLSALAVAPQMTQYDSAQSPSDGTFSGAMAALETLPVKGRAAKTGYSRDQFGNGWAVINGCDTRNIMLYRDLRNPQLDESCRVLSGTLHDPYTNQTIQFSRSESDEVQIDHVVALSDAWQKGAQLLTTQQREQFANDPLELLAVSGDANQAKADSDAASWLPDYKPFRCQYVTRQIAIKQKYQLWVTLAEKEAMQTVLARCPNQKLP